MKTIEIIPVVKDYAWGNADYIPSLIGGYTGKAQAELWMGTHPLGEATLKNGEKLSSYLEKHLDVVGADKLPLLFKILAIDSPLSLQCHPNIKQAREGWAREEILRARGEDVNYQDDNEKEEVIAALSPITAMCGFRAFDEICANLKSLIPSSYDKYLKDAKNNKDLFFALYDLKDSEKNDLLVEFRTALELLPESSWNGSFMTAKGISLKCFKMYPGDIGVVFPFILNVVNLRIGEALYLKPGTLHAYVYGNGVELMSASDNVLRGGLTSKHMDLEELGRIMSFDSEEIKKSTISYDSFGRKCYDTPSSVFKLMEASSGDYKITQSACMILLVTEGKAQIREEDGTMLLEKGSIVLIPESLKEYTLNVHGEVFMAEVL